MHSLQESKYVYVTYIPNFVLQTVIQTNTIASLYRIC